MRVDYLGLEAFVAIADFGSFQRAAEALNLSQAALSHRLRKIEQDLGAPLLIRSSREVSLTGTGQGLLPEARALLKALRDSYESVRAGARRTGRRIAFACLPSIAHSVIARVIGDFATQFPKIGIELHDIPVARISEVVRSGTAEFGLTIVSAELSDLRIRPLIEEDYHLFVHRDHPLAARVRVRLADLVDQKLARISSQSKNRQLLEVAMGDMRKDLTWDFEVQNAGLAMRLAAHNVALTILPESAIAMAPVSVVAVPFEEVRLQRTLGVVSRRGVRLSDHAAHLLHLLETELLANFRAHMGAAADPATRPRE